MQAPNLDKNMVIKCSVLDRDTECALEDLLELLYWGFDAEASVQPGNARIIFKGKLRWYAKKYLEVVCERTGITSII